MLNVVIVLAIVLVIAFGYKTGLNTGLFGIGFAYIVGCFVMGLKPNEIIAMWPTSTFFVFFSVSMFFGIASANGTMEKLSQKLLYSCRKAPVLIPYALYLAAALMTALGVSYMGAIAFMAPIALSLCDKLGIDKFIGSLIAYCGVCAGANFVTGGNGIIWLGLFNDLGYENATSLCMATFIAGVVFFFIVVTVYMIMNKSFALFKEKASVLTQPEPLDKKQKQTLALIVILMVLVLIVPVLKTFIGGSFLKTLNTNMNIGLVSVVLTIIGLILKLADQKTVIGKVPWNTLVMLSGVGMLVNLAVKAGTVEAVGAWVGSNLPGVIVPFVASLIASFMSFFASTSGVVCPALFPMVPAIAAGSGLSDAMLFAAICVGAQATAISPFSTGGSLILAACDKEEDRENLYPRFIFKAVPAIAISAAVFALVVNLIF